MSGVRVTGGSHRGRRIPLSPNTTVRPTSDKARQAFFNIVGPAIDGARFLDLFSGTGVFSLEAVSRGARDVVAVEKNPRQADEIKKIAKSWGEEITVLTSDSLRTIEQLAREEPFDLVYADPPYDYQSYRQLVEAIDEHLPLSGDAVVAIEHLSEASPLEGASLKRLQWRRTARYGNVSIALYDLAKEEEDSNDGDHGG